VSTVYEEYLESDQADDMSYDDWLEWRKEEAALAHAESQAEVEWFARRYPDD
jgi:hypothetical protein